MPDVILLTNTSNDFVLGSGDDYVLGVGVNHVNTSVDPAVDTTGTGSNSIDVAGSLFQTGSDYAISLTGTRSSLTIGETGAIYGSAAVYAVSVGGSDHTISNAGFVGGIGGFSTTGNSHYFTNTGIIETFFNALGTVHGARLGGNDNFFSNSGTIQADYGVLLGNNAQGINTGTISAKEIAVTLDHGSSSTVTFANSGVISATNDDAIRGDFGIDVISNTGTVNGDVALSIGDDILRNSGTITGNVEFSGGANRIVNTGLIDGAVTFGTAADVYNGSGSGLVSSNVNGEGGNDTLRGADLVDNLNGGSNDDLILGRAGNDLLNGDAGNDSVLGGDGDDDVRGGTGIDTLVGNSGNDVLTAGDGTDRIVAGTGDDTLRGEADNDTLRAGSGNDSLEGGTGVDFLFGENDNDELLGGADNDFLRGGNGDDFLDGGDGVDDLRGGSGDDSLEGGAGLDRLYGGGGADAFIYTDAAHSQNGAIDTIFDFRQGLDVIDLEGFAGDFTFVGTSAHTGGGTNSVRYIDTAAGVSLRADLDGNGTSDLIVTLRNLDVLSADDFLL